VRQSAKGCKASTSAWMDDFSLKRHQDIEVGGAR
jgi:hypothetical protein